MKIQIRYLILLAGLFLLCKNGLPQENYASNVKTNISDDKVLITYDIKPDDRAKSFNVILIMTYEGNQVKAASIYGDVGSNISPGTEKAIVWYFKSDLDGDVGKVDINVYVYKENEPQAIFDIVSKSNNSYAPSEVSFTNNSSYANEYQWDFGDPGSGEKNISFEKDPTHIYETGGIYSIALIARNTQSKLENKYYQSIEIKTHEATVADFEIEGNNQQPPAKISFTNKSINGDDFKWDFGDPSSNKKNNSNEKNPEHKYRQAGVYKVVLTAKNNFSGLTDQITKEVVIEEESLPTAKFIFNLSSGIAPSTVVFKNTSSYATKYEWDFGDPASGNNNTSNEADPSHIFQQAGDYTVTLSAYGSSKKPDKYSEIINIKEMPKPPEAKFSIKNNNVLGPATIVFLNNSLNASEYSWDFGDPSSGNNNSSDKENPTHTYKNAGRYKVELSARSKNFIETSKTTDYVIITEPSNPPVARFSISGNNVPVPASVKFTSESVNADSYLWDFGDPESGTNTSSQEAVSHTYTKAGRYKVSLVATNSASGEKNTFSDYVIVTEQAKTIIMPDAKFTIRNNNKPGPVTVSFVNNSTDAHSFSWNFGDPNSDDNTSVLKDPVHVYASPGTYKVELMAKNESSGTTDIFSDFVIVTEPAKPAIQPVARFKFENNRDKPSTVIFENISDDADVYEWNFGDPESSDNISSEANPTHTFSKQGRYSVELKATNTVSGLTNTYSQFINIAALIVAPKADFSIQNNHTTEPATIKFTNTSENANSLAWNFGDPTSGENNTSKLENPSHVYNRAGEYEVVLAVLNKESGKEDIIKKTVVVEQKAEPPIAGFNINTEGKFAPVELVFNNLSTNADTYNWNFGDYDSELNKSSLQNPSHYYSIPGEYQISLEAVNSQSGETNKISKKIILKSSYTTFVKTGEAFGNYEVAYSVTQLPSGEIISIVNSPGKGSSLIKSDKEGNQLDVKETAYQAYDICQKPENAGLVVLGIESPDKLVVQNIGSGLSLENIIVFNDRKNFKTDNGTPSFTYSVTNELGVISNFFGDKYPIDLLFEKLNKSGNPIPVIDRTFKYIGTKVANDIIPIEDGGYALTGYYKEEENDPYCVFLGKIDRKQHGELHLVVSEKNYLGWDIESSYQGGFAILNSDQNVESPDLYELNFMLVDKDGGPTDCSTMLPCTIKDEDIFNHRPTMIKSNDGYIIASHSFNGSNYNIGIFWIDKTGEELVKYHEINRPNDQFVMDFIEANDGGFLIVGTERVKNKFKAILIKTDPFGMLN